MPDRNRPIFVVCAPRSGSTLLRLILNAHPHIAVPPPAWLYELIRPYLYSYGDLTSAENFKALCADMLGTPTIARWPLTLDAEALQSACRGPSFAAAFEELHLAFGRLGNKMRWGEKTPRNSFWIDEIKQDFPDAQIVHIVRDGRDMAIDIADSPPMRPYSLYMGAQYWRHYVSAIRESAMRLNKSDFYEIRYEELCASPQSELEKLCAFLGEEFDGRMLTHHDTGGAKSWSEDPQHAKTAQPITTDFCEMYKTRLPARDVAALEAVFGELLDAYDYPRAGAAEPISERVAMQLMQSDLVSSPDNYAYKAELTERRRARQERGVYKTSERSSLLWSTT